MTSVTATKRRCSWWRRKLTRHKGASIPVYYIILIVVAKLLGVYSYCMSIVVFIATQLTFSLFRIRAYSL